MSSQSYPLTLRDSSDYIAHKKAVLIQSEVHAGKSTSPSWIPSSFEYRFLSKKGEDNCTCCLIPDNPTLDHTNSRQEFGSYAGNTYLTNITVNWKRTKCAKSYKVFLVEVRSNDTSFESDEVAGAPANFIKLIPGGTMGDPASYELQYSFASGSLGSDSFSWEKTYSAADRIAKVYAFVFAYGKFGESNPIVTSQPSIRYSVFDVKPLIPLNTWPVLDFTRVSGTKSGSNLTQISVSWTPLPNAVYYKAFLIEGSGTTIVQTQTKFSKTPKKYDNSGDLFTSSSGKLTNNMVEFEKIYTVLQNVSKVTVFIYAFDASDVSCPMPGRSITFDASSNITMDYTLNSPNNGINYYLNDDGSSYLNVGPSLPLDSLESKSFL